MSAAPATASGHTSTSRCVSTETRSTRSATSDRIRSRASHVYCLEVVSRDGGTGSGLRRRKRLPTAPAVSPRGGRKQLRRFLPAAGRGTRIGPSWWTTNEGAIDGSLAGSARPDHHPRDPRVRGHEVPADHRRDRARPLAAGLRRPRRRRSSLVPLVGAWGKPFEAWGEPGFPHEPPSFSRYTPGVAAAPAGPSPAPPADGTVSVG